jgi:hypothetical protein
MSTISSRVLKWTYGIAYFPKWQAGDPLDRKLSDGRVKKFWRYAKRGDPVAVDETPFTGTNYPCDPKQTSIRFQIFYTSAENASFCDEVGMMFLGDLTIGKWGRCLNAFRYVVSQPMLVCWSPC